MNDRINLTELRAHKVDKTKTTRCSISRDTLAALVDAVETAHQWQELARHIVKHGIGESGYCVQVVQGIAGSPALGRFDFTAKEDA